MQQTQARVNIYALLSRIMMQELDVKMLKMIKEDENVLSFFPTLKEWKPLFEIEEEKLLQEYINPDFVNLTILHLIPYESFYVRDDQMIETGGANPVTDMYSAYNFMVDYEASRTVSSDHIGVELEFMHHLSLAELKALQEDDMISVKEIREVELEFLQKHLIKWTPLFLINMKYEARTPLYYDAAEMALEFILSDYEYLCPSSL